MFWQCLSCFGRSNLGVLVKCFLLKKENVLNRNSSQDTVVAIPFVLNSS